MVKTSFTVDYPFETVLEAFRNEEVRKLMSGNEGDKKKISSKQINERTKEEITRQVFPMHIPFMSDREMLLKQIFYYPYSKDDCLSYSTNTTHPDYPKDDKLVRCDVRYLATYFRKEGNKTRMFRFSHFNMEISMMNKFAGGSAAIKKTNEFINGLKKACDSMKK